MLKEIQKLLSPIRRRLNMILGRAVIAAITDDNGLQQCQISLLKNELVDKIDRYQNYGFTSHPKPGSQAVAVFNGGVRSNGVVICVDDKRYRLKGLEEGEVAIYTDEGDSIVFKRDRKIEVTTKSFVVNSETCDLQASKSLSIKTKETTIETQKFKVTDGTNDITALLIEWMSEVIAATTNTMLGPMKLLGVKFPSVKTKLEKFKS